jgi:hypothetical protein
MDASWMSHGHKLMYNIYMHVVYDVDKKIVRLRGRLKCNANGNYRNNRSVKTRAQRPSLYETHTIKSNQFQVHVLYDVQTENQFSFVSCALAARL